jgi:hypothetical protein
MPELTVDTAPLGSRALAIGGGYWVRVKRGWAWCSSGCVFPTPGGDAYKIIGPDEKTGYFDSYDKSKWIEGKNE